ncbi:MAG: 6-carboxytetrahydropterin synthase QueD [Treponema sp.]|nr:6-carboxytetrahydropterin synthase QueD [Treponema sp.]
MYSVRVESDFSAAHFLSHYQGKCEQLHGHNYRVRLWAQGNDLNEGGMLVDFALLKDTLRLVCKKLDHTNLNDNAVFKNDPSTERIARYIFDEVCKLLSSEIAELVSAVDVFETPGSMARFTRQTP